MNFKAFIAGFVVALVSFAAMPVDAAGRVSSRGYSSKSYSSPSRSYSRSYSRPTAPRQNYNRPQQSQRPIVQKNYYNNNGGGYRGGMGGYQGPGIGTSILGGAAGAVGGVMLYDALKGSGSDKEAAQLQREQSLVQNAKEQQARDDKMYQMEQKQDQILQNQQRQVAPQEPFYQLGGQR